MGQGQCIDNDLGINVEPCDFQPTAKLSGLGKAHHKQAERGGIWYRQPRASEAFHILAAIYYMASIPTKDAPVIPNQSNILGPEKLPI